MKMKMRKSLFAASVTIALLTTSALYAQETVTGAVGGAAVGAVVGGPVGALIGAGVGGTAGAASESARYRYEGDIRTGVVLPSTGVVYRPVPDQYYLSSYRGPHRYVYAVVDDSRGSDRVVVVDPATHAVIQVVQ
jgi:hypothetical protein